MTSPELKLAQAATVLWGRSWARPLHEFTGLNLRTCQRLQADIAAGGENPRAAGALAALQDALNAVIQEITHDQ